LLHMSEEKNIDEMAYIKVSYGNIERIKAVSKKGDTFNDVVAMLLDYYEDLHRQDWINTRAVEKQEEGQLSV
jgi:hypothetical protein